MGMTIRLEDPYEKYVSVGGRYAYVHCMRRAIIIIVKIYIDNTIEELVEQFNCNNNKTFTVDECISHIENKDDEYDEYEYEHELVHIEDLIETKKIFGNMLDDANDANDVNDDTRINYSKVELYAHDADALIRLVRTDLYGAFKFINHSDCEGYFSKGDCVDINNTLKLINKTFESLYNNNEITKNKYGDMMYKNKVLDYDTDLVKLFAQAVKIHKCVSIG